MYILIVPHCCKKLNMLWWFLTPIKNIWESSGRAVSFYSNQVGGWWVIYIEMLCSLACLMDMLRRRVTFRERFKINESLNFTKAHWLCLLMCSSAVSPFPYLYAWRGCWPLGIRVALCCASNTQNYYDSFWVSWGN